MNWHSQTLELAQNMLVFKNIKCLCEDCSCPIFGVQFS